jgi:hypothetical protein
MGLLPNCSWDRLERRARATGHRAHLRPDDRQARILKAYSSFGGGRRSGRPANVPLRGTLFHWRRAIRKDPMLKQVWTDVNVELPPDRWVGRIKIRVAQGHLEKECLGFQKKNPITGAENDFTYQHGILDGQTDKLVIPPGAVTRVTRVNTPTQVNILISRIGWTTACDRLPRAARPNKCQALFVRNQLL